MKMYTLTPSLLRAFSVAALAIAGLASNQQAAAAWTQVAGTPTITTVLNQTFVFATGTDGHLNMYAPSISNHYSDVAAPNQLSMVRSDVGTPPGISWVSGPTATSAIDPNNVGHVFVFASASDGSVAQGLVTLGNATTPASFRWGPEIPAFPSIFGNRAVSNLSVTSSDNLYLTLYGVVGAADNQSVPNDEIVMIGNHGPWIPSATPWTYLGAATGASPGESVMLTPSPVIYHWGNYEHRVFANGGTTGLLYQDSSFDFGSTWSWKRPTGVPASSPTTGGSVVPFGQVSATTFRALNGNQQINAYVPSVDGNVYEIAALNNSLSTAYHFVGAPILQPTNNGPVGAPATGLSATSYSDGVSQGIYVAGAVNGLSFIQLPSHGVMVCAFGNGTGGWTWEGLGVPLNWMDTVGPPAATVDAPSSGSPRLTVAEIPSDGHLYTRTVYNNNFTAANPATSDWKLQEPAGVPGIDLVVTNITWTPANPHVGDHVVFSATVKNQGVAATPNNTIVGVLFQVNGNPYVTTWSDTDTTSLKPQQSVTVTANSGRGSTPQGNYWVAGGPGTFSVTGWVDDQNRFVESNHSNNTLVAHVITQ